MPDFNNNLSNQKIDQLNQADKIINPQSHSGSGNNEIHNHFHNHQKPTFQPNLNLPKTDGVETVGREDERKKISKLLQSGNDTLITTGVGGVGKTKLARYVASSMLKNENPDGYYEHIAMMQVDTSRDSQSDSFKSKVVSTFSPVFRKALAFIPNLPTDENQLYELLVGEMKDLNSPKLLILDDVTKDWLAQNRSRINSDFQGWHILATSRDSGDYGFLNFKKIILDNLTKENAINLFKKILTEYQTDLPDENKIEKLIEILGGHALSVSFFASLLGQDLDLNIDQVLDKLKQGLTFEHSGVDIEYRNLTQTQVETVMKLALDLARLDQFTETQRTHLRQFSILPAEFIDYKKYKEILELSLEEQENKDKFKTIQEDFKVLTRYGFLEKQEGSYKMHKVMQKAIRAELELTPENIESCEDLVVGLIRHFKFSGTNKDYTLLFKDLELGNSVTEHFLKGWQKENQNTENLKKYKNLATLINNLANVYESQGKYPEAEKLYKQALEIDKKTIGEEHPKYAIHLWNLGDLYLKWGKKEKEQTKLKLAQTNIKQALDIFKTKLGEGHPYTQTVQGGLDAVEAELGE